MLYQENKKIVIIFLFTLFIGCNKYKTYNTEEINNIRDNSIRVSLSIVGEENYCKIYNQLNDSIKNWRNNKLKWYDEDIKKIDSQIDSVLCFNENGDKMIATRLMSGNGSDKDVMDAIIYYYGLNINNTWYFFSGATMYVPRKNYQEDIHTPISFERLKQIATDRVYRGYLVKDKNGEWKVNESFFSRFYERDAYNYPFTTQEAWEESWLRLNKAKWEKRDATELE
jgi:hypothetical protein